MKKQYKIILSSIIYLLLFSGFNNSDNLIPENTESAIISLSSTNYNFNQRRINSLCGFKFTVTNQGADPLIISSMTCSTQRFRLDTVELTFPVTLPASSSKVFRVWFNPVSNITYNDSLTIVSNASNLPVAKLALSGSGINITSNLGYIFWQGLVPDNPFTSYDDYQPISIKQINDVNNDGVNDIVVASGNYLTTCFNGNSSDSSDILWIFNTGYNNNNTGSVTWEDGMQIRDDVNGDGIQDVVIGCAGGNEEVYTISGRTGKKIWEYGDSVSYSDGDIEALRTDKDFNGDGVKDVLVSASGTGSGNGGRHSVICLNGLNGNVIFNVAQPSSFTGDIVSTVFGGAIGNGTPNAVKGFDNFGNNTWTYPTASKVWTMKVIPSIGIDTVKEIIGNFGFSGDLFCIAENNGTVNWTKTLGSSNNGRIQLLDDLDSNGYIDFTLYGPQVAYRIDSKTNNILWSNPLASSYLRGADFLSDVNGDGKRDVLISTQVPGKVLVLNGANGNILFTHQWGTTLTQRGDRCASMQSLDGNPTTEFIGGCRDGRIICFSGGQNIPVGINPVSVSIPDKFELFQNYPNPFNPSTKIRFNIPVMSPHVEDPDLIGKRGLRGVSIGNPLVTLKIYDIQGRQIATFINEKLQPGTYETTWDATNNASGIYFYTLLTGNFIKTKKMIVLK